MLAAHQARVFGWGCVQFTLKEGCTTDTPPFLRLLAGEKSTAQAASIDETAEDSLLLLRIRFAFKFRIRSRPKCREPDIGLTRRQLNKQGALESMSPCWSDQTVFLINTLKNKL